VPAVVPPSVRSDADRMGLRRTGQVREQAGPSQNENMTVNTTGRKSGRGIFQWIGISEADRTAA